MWISCRRVFQPQCNRVVQPVLSHEQLYDVAAFAGVYQELLRQLTVEKHLEEQSQTGLATHYSWMQWLCLHQLNGAAKGRIKFLPRSLTITTNKRC